MEPGSIYRSPEGEAAILYLYDRMLADLSLATEDRTVPTRFGGTHVLVTGPEGAPPVVLFHGGNSLNPLTLEWFSPLAGRFRIHAPDTVGQPGKSAQTRPSAKDRSFGSWVTDVLDGLNLERAALVGPSHGAGIALKAAILAPERISKMVLFVPSGIVGVPVRKLASLGLPYLLYRLYPRREVVALSVCPLCGDELDEKMLAVTEAVFRHVRIEPSMPRLAERGVSPLSRADAGHCGGERHFVPGSEGDKPGSRSLSRSGTDRTAGGLSSPYLARLSAARQRVDRPVPGPEPSDAEPLAAAHAEHHAAVLDNGLQSACFEPVRSSARSACCRSSTTIGLHAHRQTFGRYQRGSAARKSESAS